jgi:flagellar biogenesis protein FliO
MFFRQPKWPNRLIIIIIIITHTRAADNDNEYKPIKTKMKAILQLMCVMIWLIVRIVANNE